MNQLYRQKEASQDPLCQSPQAPAGAPQLIGAYLSCSLHYKNTKMMMSCGYNESFILISFFKNKKNHSSFCHVQRVTLVFF